MTSRVHLMTALGAIYLVWGSTYLAIKITVETAPPLLAGGTRFLLAGIVLAIWVAARRGVSALRLTRAELGACAATAVLLLVIGNGLTSVAEQYISSSMTALLIASVPLVVVGLRLASGERPARATVINVFVGFAGITLLVGVGGGGPVLGMLAVVVASISWAFGSWLSPRLAMPADGLAATAWQMLLGGAAMTLVGTGAGEWNDFTLASVSGRSWAAWAYLIVGGSLIAFPAYLWLLRHAPLSLVSTYAYVNPTVAVVLGVIVLDERVTPGMLFGGMAVVASVALIVSTEAAAVRADERRADRADACASDTAGHSACGSCAASCALAGASTAAGAAAAPTR